MQGDPLPEHTTENLYAQAFPTLFLFGVGDVTVGSRREYVFYTEANEHYFNYILKNTDSDGNSTTSFPFAEHPRWMYWVHNMAERKRCSGQRSIYIQRSPHDANLTEESLRRIVEDGGEELNS